MLRRNSCRSQSRRPLSRSKSTNSVVRNPVHELGSIEPFTAERDAHIAATLSYHRAQAQGKNGSEAVAMPRDSSSTTLARSNSFTSGPDVLSYTSAISRHDSTTSNRGIRRQQSVRFVGPNARPRRDPAARASMASAGPTRGSVVLDGFGHEGQRPGADITRDKRREKRPLSRNYADARQFRSEAYVSEDNVASMPSSYRKLRKSRSMYTPSTTQPPSYSCNNGSSVDRLKEWLATPHHPPLTKKENDPIGDPGMPTLRAPKSMSFLRSHRERSTSRVSSHADNDLAIQLAHQRFREQSEPSNRLRSQPSTFFRSKHKRNPSSTSFPKSLRNSSNNSTALSAAFSGGTISVSKQPGLRTTARKVSKSLKSRIKGLFSRPKSADYSAEQTQDQDLVHDSDGDSCYRIQQSPHKLQEASMYQVPSHMPFFHAVPSNQQLRSRKGSVESVKGEDNQPMDDKSRVTSWTNSTTETVTGPTIQGDWDHQRLPVIKENGLRGGPANHHETPSLGEIPPPRGPIIDSERVYSALMKRLEESKQHENRGQLLSREGSSYTIRCVQDDDDDDDVFQDHKRGPSRGPSASPESVIRGQKASGSTVGAAMDNAYPKPAVGNGRGLCSDKSVMNSRANVEPPRPLSSRSSAFFASPTCHLFRTASPYRRALRESMGAAQTTDQAPIPSARYLGSLSALSLPARRPSTSDSEKDVRVTYAESIYSCNSDDKKLSVNRNDDPSNPSVLNHGDATIFVNSPVYKPKASSNHKRNISSASSVEWKMWLSANVSKLEAPSTALKAGFPEDPSHVLHPLGHVREDTEIEPEGDTIKGEDFTPEISTTVMPLKFTSNPETPQSTSATSRSQQPASLWRRRTSVANENSPPTTGGRSRESCSKETPLMPSKSSLRTVPSLSNVNMTVSSEPKSRYAAGIPRMRSMNTITAKSSPPVRDQILLKRQSRTRLIAGDAGSAKSSPGLTSAVERQFGAAKTDSPGKRGLAAQPPQFPCTPRSETGGVINGMERRELDPQVLGSKRMVDLFLSSRRKRVDGNGTRQSSDSFSAVFI